MTVAALSFAGMGALIKRANQLFPVPEVVFFRGLVGIVLLVVLERLRHGRLIPSVHRRNLTLRSVFGATALLLYVWSISHIDLGLANALNQSSPLFVAALSPFLLGESLPPRLVIFIGLGFLGVWLVVSPDLGQVDLASVAGLASGALAGLAYIWVRKLRSTDQPSVIVRWYSVFTMLVALPFVAAGDWTVPGFETWGLLLGVGGTAMAGQLTLSSAYRFAPAGRISPFLYLQVPGSLALGYMFYGEVPRLTAAAGVVLLLAACVALGVYSEQRRGSLG